MTSETDSDVAADAHKLDNGPTELFAGHQSGLRKAAALAEAAVPWNGLGQGGHAGDGGHPDALGVLTMRSDQYLTAVACLGGHGLRVQSPRRSHGARGKDLLPYDRLPRLADAHYDGRSHEDLDSKLYSRLFSQPFLE